MHPKFENVAIHKTSKDILRRLAKVTGISQARLIDDYLKAIAEWISAYERATIRFDDSDTRITSNEQVIKIRISGISKMDFGIKKVEGEPNTVIDKVIKIGKGAKKIE